MKNLIIVRHGKSSWENQFDIKDIDRPLTLRGVNDGIKMAEHLDNQLFKPDKIISSNGIRALHTATIFARGLKISAQKIKILDELYHCTACEIEMTLMSLNDKIETVAVFCHNPGITDFASKYIPNFYDNVPTTGVLYFTLNSTTWKNLSTENLKLKDFKIPKKL